MVMGGKSQNTILNCLILEGVAISALLLAGLTLLLGPILSDSYSIPSAFPDGWQFVWNVWWLRQSSSEAESLYFTHYLFHHYGTGLYLHTLSEALLWPLAKLFSSLSPQQVVTFASALAIFLNGITAYILFRTITGKAYIATLLTLCWTIHPYFTGHLYAGHLNLLCFFPVHLIALWALRTFSGKSTGSCLIAAVSWGLLPYLSLYYFYFASAIVVGVILVALLLPRYRPLRPITFVVPFAIAAVVAAIKVVPVSEAANSTVYFPNHPAKKHALDLAAYVLPSNIQAYATDSPLTGWGKEVTTHLGEHSAQIGFSLLILLGTLAAVSIYKRTWKLGHSGLALLIFVLAALSFGPKWRLFGEPVFTLPIYSLAAKSLPFFPSVPARFTVLTLFGLFLLTASLAKGVHHYLGGTLRIAIVLFLVGTILEYYPAPLSPTSYAPHSVLLNLKNLSNVSGVYDSSPIPEHQMARQIYHQKPIVEGYISRRPLKPLKRLRRNCFSRCILNGARCKRPCVEQGWRELKVQALLVENSQGAAIERAEQLSWLERFSSDERATLFVDATALAGHFL